MGALTALMVSTLLPSALAWGSHIRSHNSSTPHTSYNYTAPYNYPVGNWTDSLPQNETNGCSTWGTFENPSLGNWVNGPFPYGSSTPWGEKLANDTNPYDKGNCPNTGMTRYYDWVITNTTLAPDGVAMPMLVVNDQFPGPLIEANWGDWIEVRVRNALPDEGTALHWHGFLQTGTPYYDGVPGVTQCPIAPGETFIYRFRAELYGTTWWHSHYSSQYIQGLIGPIVVHGPKSEDYDIDLGPVLLSDWYHDYYQNLIQQVYFASDVGPILPPMANNMLIQGKGNYNCSLTDKPCALNAGTAQFKFETGKKHLLRLINTAAEALIFFSIDGYQLTVIAQDFVPIEPYQTDLVKIAVGQRVDIIVEGKNDTSEAVWMRISQGPSGLGPRGSTGCSLNDGNFPEVTAAIYYENADISKVPVTNSTIAPSRLLFPLACSNDALNATVPAFAIPVKEPDVTLNFVLTAGDNATGAFVWWINNVTFIADFNDPTLLEAKLGNYDFPIERAVYNLHNATSVRINMRSVGFPASHPMHIHGHNLQVLAEGSGTWDGTTIINPDNPTRRDTQLIRPAGYLVVQFDLDNPGVWAFHCHVAWHISEGMNVLLLSQPDALKNDIEIPYSVAQTCRQWSDWSGSNIVNQIDSGL